MYDIPEGHRLSPGLKNAVDWCSRNRSEDYENCVVYSVALYSTEEQTRQERQEGAVIALLLIVFSLGYFITRRWRTRN